jgi:antibiotic biosynthesis monooxygenase (ABM) superfamily enzyme
MRKDKYLWVTASRAKPGKEAEYNQWYDQHVTTFFKFPGLKRVSRNRCFQSFEFGEKCARYMTIYEFDDKEALEAFRKSDVMLLAKKEYEDSWEEIGETLWTGWWEPMKTLERK